MSEQRRRRVALAVAIGAGVAVALQSRANGELGHRVGSPLLPAWLTMVVGGTILAVIVLARYRGGVATVVREVRAGRLPWFLLTGGFIGTFFLITQSVVVPLMGVAVFTVGVVAGQTTGSMLADRVGLAGTGPQAITARRVIASLLAIGAVVIAVSDRLGSAQGSLALVIMAFVAGTLFAPQQAFNGRVGRAAGSPFVGALGNFAGGVLATSVVLAIALTAGGVRLHDLGGAPWWAYLGGVLGMAAIASAAGVVPILGVLIYTLASVLGQLLGALVLDAVAPTSGTGLGVQLVIGAAITAVAVGVATLSRRTRRG